VSCQSRNGTANQHQPHTEHRQRGSDDDPCGDRDVLEHHRAQPHRYQRIDRGQRRHQRDRTVADRGKQGERAQAVADPGHGKPEQARAGRLHGGGLLFPCHSDRVFCALPIRFRRFSNPPGIPSLVMPGLDPGIRPSSGDLRSGMDCRVKPGNDDTQLFRGTAHGDP
jgi:hypothetical protein